MRGQQSQNQPGQAVSDGWTLACAAADVPEGTVVPLSVGGRDVVVVQVAGEYFALDGICTHALGYLDEGDVDGFELECPLHGGRFDVRSGAATLLPAEEPLRTYPVTVVDGAIHLRLTADHGR